MVYRVMQPGPAMRATADARPRGSFSFSCSSASMFCDFILAHEYSARFSAHDQPIIPCLPPIPGQKSVSYATDTRPRASFSFSCSPASMFCDFVLAHEDSRRFSMWIRKPSSRARMVFLFSGPKLRYPGPAFPPNRMNIVISTFPRAFCRFLLVSVDQIGFHPQKRGLAPLYRFPGREYGRIWG